MNTSVNRILLAGLLLLTASGCWAGNRTANLGVTNNYLWRGLTQTTNEPAISGGIDYSADNGFYVGTWTSNVQYAADDVFSYEHDFYFGWSGESGDFSYDISYLYYAYDRDANADFSEVAGIVGYNGFSVSLYLLAHTETKESVGRDIIGHDYDFSFGETASLSFDYSFALKNEVEVGVHLGIHEGDFVDALNFQNGTDQYVDYAISVVKEGLSFVISRTDLADSPAGLQNDEVKFAVSYILEFDW